MRNHVMTIFLRKLKDGSIGLGALAIFLLSSSCVVGPKYHPPAPQAPAPAYQESTTQFQDLSLIHIYARRSGRQRTE